MFWRSKWLDFWCVGPGSFPVLPEHLWYEPQILNQLSGWRLLCTLRFLATCPAFCLQLPWKAPTNCLHWCEGNVSSNPIQNLGSLLPPLSYQHRYTNFAILSFTLPCHVLSLFIKKNHNAELCIHVFISLDDQPTCLTMSSGIHSCMHQELLIPLSN